MCNARRTHNERARNLARAKSIISTDRCTMLKPDAMCHCDGKAWVLGGGVALPHKEHSRAARFLVLRCCRALGRRRVRRKCVERSQVESSRVCVVLLLSLYRVPEMEINGLSDECYTVRH